MTDTGNASARRRRPGRPKGGQIVADRAQLLVAATQVIRERGPDATMDDIAAGALVTKPILYRTIGDKAALGAVLAESLIDQIDRSVHVAIRSATDPLAAFEAAIRGYVDAVEADRNVFLFVYSAAPGTDQFHRLVDRLAAPMVVAFGGDPSGGGPDAVEGRIWAWALVGAMQVATTMWMRDEARDPDALVRVMSQLLWSGLGPTLSGGLAPPATQ